MPQIGDIKTEAGKQYTYMPGEYWRETTPKLTVPTTPTTEIDLSKAPTLPVDNSSLMAGISGLLGQLGATQEQINTALAGFKPATAETPKGALGYLASLAGQRPEVPSITEQYQKAREETFAMFGMTPEVFQQQQALIGELTDYKKQITDLEAQKETRLLGAEQQYQGRLTDLLRGEQGLIERQYNSKIAAVSASAAVVQYQYQLQAGQIEQAMGMVDKIVQLQVYDYEQKVKDYQWTYDTFKDVISMWSAEEQNEWQKQFQTTQFDWNKKMDVARLELQRQQEARLAEAEKVPTTKEVGGVLYQWDAATQTWKPAPGVTPGISPQQITRDTTLINNAVNEKTAFGSALSRSESLTTLADMAVQQGASFEAFKTALQTRKDLNITSDNRVYVTGGVWGISRTLGNLDDVKNKFEVKGITPTEGQEELNKILFGEEEF